MKTVRVHILKERYTQKPNRKEMGKISKNVTENIYEMELLTFAEEVGENGHAFTTAIFNGDRNTENFSRREIFAMDFDKGLTVGAFMEKAKKYNVLPVFLYATYNYTEEDNRFRAVFISDCIAENAHAAKVMNGLLLELFPEADTCSKDISHFFLGGKKLLYFNEYAKINLKDIAVSVQVLLKEKDRINYSRKIKKIGKDLNIAVEHGLLCIHKISEIAENEEYWKMPYIIMGDSLKSSNSCVFHTQTHLANKCEKRI